MSISITIIQTCNGVGCDNSRRLETTSFVRGKVDGDFGGWREVMHNKHLCPKCINAMVAQNRSSIPPD